MRINCNVGLRGTHQLIGVAIRLGQHMSKFNYLLAYLRYLVGAGTKAIQWHGHFHNDFTYSLAWLAFRRSLSYFSSISLRSGGFISQNNHAVA